MHEEDIRKIVREELAASSDAGVVPRIRHRIAVAIAERLVKPFISPDSWERFLGLEEAVSRLYPVLCYAHGKSEKVLDIALVEEMALLFERWQKMAEFLIDIYETAPRKLTDVWNKDALMEQAAHAGTFREKFLSEIVENGGTHLPLEHLEWIKEMIALTRLVLFGEERLAAFIEELNNAWEIARTYPPLSRTLMA